MQNDRTQYVVCVRNKDYTASLELRKIYAVIQNRRYVPQIRRVRKFLAQGTIGERTTVHCDFYLAPHFGGFRDQMRHPLILDMAIHTFDAARYLTGADATAVYCREWNPAGSWYAHGASAVAIFEMTGGLVYTYRGSWSGEGCSTSWECDWRFQGTRGSAVWDGGDKFRAQVVKPGGQPGFWSELEDAAWPESDEPDKVGGHAGLVKEFLRCVRTGATPETICTDNIQSLAMVFGAIESAETGKRVELSR